MSQEVFNRSASQIEHEGQLFPGRRVTEADPPLETPHPSLEVRSEEKRESGKPAPDPKSRKDSASPKDEERSVEQVLKETAKPNG